MDEALEAYRRAVEIKPDSAPLHWNLAFLLLSLGRFAEGWEEFEWRLKDETKSLRREFAQPKWNGEDLGGKRLLVYAEGGYGDAIQFVRYVPLLRGRAKKIVLECPPRVVRLFSDIPGVDEIVERGKTLPEFDCRISLLSLPRIFRTELNSIPNSVPYLKASAIDELNWKGRVQGGGRLKVGLAWAGSARERESDDVRTRGLSILGPLGRTPGVRFYSLQMGPEASEARPAGMDVVDFSGDQRDFADTAGLIANLDLVISVDTSLAHLAGAMAKRVWVMVPNPADFRWLLDRADSPWYPTMRLFRQRRRGDWDGVVAEMGIALGELAEVG